MSSRTVNVFVYRPALRAERAFVVIVLLLSLGAFSNLMITGPIRTQNMGMLGMQIAWTLVYLVVLTSYSRNCVRPIRMLFVLWPLLIVIAFAFVSVLWSQAPMLTLRRATALALSFVFGVYFSTRFDLEEQFSLLGYAFAVCIVFSFTVELLGMNPSQEIPGWYGIFYHKTELGRNFVLGTLLYLYWWKIDRRYRQLAIVGCIASVLLVLLSRDVTSLLTLVLLLIALLYLRRSMTGSVGWALARTAVFCTGGSALVFFALGHLESVTRLLGKDPMLTGRVPLWILSTAMALRKPWLGYGFNAFWLPDNVYVQRIWHLLRWEPPHAHNGMLELWLELGALGAILFVGAFLYYCAFAIRLLRCSRKSCATWPLIFLVFFFVANLTETFFVTENNIFFFLFVAVAFMCRQGAARTLLGSKETAA